MKMGTAKYGKTEFKKKNYFKVTESPQVFAIIPPIGDLADAGIWSRFYSVHFGYKNMEGKTRAFLSPLVKNNKTKMIEVPDAALDRINNLKAKLEEAEAQGNKETAARFFKLVGQSKTSMPVYNLDNNHYMNVHDLEGNIGQLKMRHRCKLKLEVEIKKLQDAGVDPLSASDGRYFTIYRTGTGSDTNFDITVYTKEQEFKTPDGKSVKAKMDVVRTMSDSLINRLATEAFDLDKLFQKVTAEECKAIVDASEITTGKSPMCDEIFDNRWKAAREAKVAQNAAPVAAAAAAPATTPPASYEDPTNETPDDVETAPTSTLASAPASTPVAKASEPAKVAAPAPAATSFETLSDEDFFKTVGLSVN